MAPRHVTVLGGGISGLTAAFYLARQLPKSARITVVEKASRVGGWIRSFPIEGSRIALESGPRTFRGSNIPHGVLQLIQDLGLTNYLVTTPLYSPASHLRYIYLDGQGLALIPPTPFQAPFSKFSWTVLPIIREWFKDPNRPEHIDDESLDTLLSRRFGHDIARVLGSSMIHGIFAADSRELSVKAAFPLLYHAERFGKGSVIRGMPKALAERDVKQLFVKMGSESDVSQVEKALQRISSFTFLGGLEMVPRTLEARLRDKPNVHIKLETECISLDRSGEGFKLKLSDESELESSHVLSTLPLPALHSITSKSEAYQTTPLPELLHNGASSVQVLNLVFPPTPRPIHPPGFGFLVPRPAQGYPVTATRKDGNGQALLQNVLGVVFDSSIDPAHNHKTQPTIMTMMLGGPFPLYKTPTEPYTGSTNRVLAEEELDLFLRSLEYYLAPSNPLPRPILNALHTHYNAIPTYKPGSRAVLDGMRSNARNGSWSRRLVIDGMGVGGVGLADRVSGARASVARILDADAL